MVAQVGSLLVGLALAAILYAAWATWRSARHPDPRWMVSGRRALHGGSILLGTALLLLLYAFLADQFQIRYVAQHSSRALPRYLKVSAIWAGQAGSLLVWAFLQTVFAALVASRTPGRFQALVPRTAALLSVIAGFFCGVTLFLANPFVRSLQVPPDGQGMNPLLRHPGMALHPPLLYVGYVGLAVPFAFALSALVGGQVDEWPAAARLWTSMAWLFLGLGILLGARWAYDVLGWGGYWSWDPVENAGLMPWLTATALLHTTLGQSRRRAWRTWNVLLATLSFALVVFGTFTTRSGLIQSVHAFTQSRLGPYFLVLLGLTLGGAAGLLIYRRRMLLNGASFEVGLLSRSGAVFVTLLLLLAITTSVLIGTLLPTVTGGRFEAPPAWFDRVVGPQLGVLVLLMGVCPVVGRIARAGRGSLRHALPPLIGAFALTAVAALGGFARPLPLVGFALSGLAVGAALGELGPTLVRLTRPTQGVIRRIGAHTVHLGIGLMALGVIGTRAYGDEANVTLSAEKPVDVGTYHLVYQDAGEDPAGDHVDTWVAVAVNRGANHVTTLRPRLAYYPASDQTMAMPAVASSLREDLYLVLYWRSDEGAVGLQVMINPLVNFLWVGGVMMLAGGAAVAWSQPSLDRAQARAARESRPGRSSEAEA